MHNMNPQLPNSQQSVSDTFKHNRRLSLIYPLCGIELPFNVPDITKFQNKKVTTVSRGKENYVYKYFGFFSETDVRI